MNVSSCALFISFIFFPFSQIKGKEIIVIPGLQLDFKNCKSFIVLENRVKMQREQVIQKDKMRFIFLQANALMQILFVVR